MLPQMHREYRLYFDFSGEIMARIVPNWRGLKYIRQKKHPIGLIFDLRRCHFDEPRHPRKT